MDKTVIDYAPDDFLEKIAASATRRWPGCYVKRVKAEVATRSGGLKVYRTYGAFLDGKLIAAAKVNRAGSVYWYWTTSGLSTAWEEE